jgi:hypothetical protein
MKPNQAPKGINGNRAPACHHCERNRQQDRMGATFEWVAAGTYDKNHQNLGGQGLDKPTGL